MVVKRKAERKTNQRNEESNRKTKIYQVEGPNIEVILTFKNNRESGEKNIGESVYHSVVDGQPSDHRAEEEHLDRPTDGPFENATDR